MKPVRRDELMDYITYSEERDALRGTALQAKALRRVVVGDVFAFLFENRETVRYQVQEMMRVERIVKEEDIAHELATYNELLGGPGELGCSLLIGITDEGERDRNLRRWLSLPAHIYVRLPDGSTVRPSYDPRQVGDDRLSSVQYLKFAVNGVAPLSVGIDLPEIGAETTLTSEQRTALQKDLVDGT